jgi:hypothetical protein
MTVTYRTGYAATRRTLTELYAWPEFAGVHPEMQKRLVGWLDSCRAHGIDTGIGEGIRTVAEQEALFYNRHIKVVSGGCCSYKGARYALRSGMAHAAPPGRSYHEPVLNGKCLAVDTVGHNTVTETLLAAYGLRSFNNLTGAAREAWHVQPLEVPTSRTSYNPAIHVLRNWPMPGVIKPEIDYPKPTLKQGSTGAEVYELQQHLTFWKWYNAAIDGSFGPVTTDSVRKMQAALRQTQDGVYGPVTANAYLAFLKALQA